MDAYNATAVRGNLAADDVIVNNISQDIISRIRKANLK